MMFTILSALLQATAKGSLAIVVVALFERLIRSRVPARWRYALWLVIVLRLVIPVAPASAWSLFAFVPPHPAVEWQLRGPAAQIVFNGSDGAIDVPWWIAQWRWLAALWIAGMIVVIGRTLVATWRVRAIVRAAQPVSQADVVDAARRQLAIAREVRVAESAAVDVPSLHGVFRPMLLLPAGACETFTADEMRHVVLHELSHLRRHDVAFNWLLTAVRAIHWFNPFAHFAVARIAEERELACDELTLSCLADHERHGYGMTILKLLERFRAAQPVPALVGILSPKETMKRRLTMISATRTHSRLAIPLLIAVAAVALMALTDARGARESAGTLDPAAVGTLDRFDRSVSVDVRDASFAELLAIVASKSGVPITQSPAIATSPAQQARFTLHAANVPARQLLTRALLDYRLVAAPRGAAIMITKSPPCRARGAPQR